MTDNKRTSNNQGEIIDLGSWTTEEINKRAEEILAGARTSEEPKVEIAKNLPKPEYSGFLIKVYQTYENIFGTPKSVFYPACGLDASPLRGFPNSEIVFLDPAEYSVEGMAPEGIQVIQKGIEDYHEKHDLILLMNPHFNPILALDNLEAGGRIIANNYFGAPAAGPLKEFGLPLLKRLTIENNQVIELPLESKIDHEHCFVFGGKNER
jgi:hypothetical protein